MDCSICGVKFLDDPVKIEFARSYVYLCEGCSKPILKKKISRVGTSITKNGKTLTIKKKNKYSPYTKIEVKCVECGENFKVKRFQRHDKKLCLKCYREGAICEK